MWSDSVLREVRGRNRTSLEVETMAVTRVWRDLPRQASARRLRGRTGGVDIEPPCRIAEIPGAHDVVPLEDRTGLVSRELHGHTLGNAGPHEVPNRVRRKSWEMRPGQPASIRCLPPGLVEP